MFLLKSKRNIILLMFIGVHSRSDQDDKTILINHFVEDSLHVFGQQ